MRLKKPDYKKNKELFEKTGDFAENQCNLGINGYILARHD
jgi:hypothetical protein